MLSTRLFQALMAMRQIMTTAITMAMVVMLPSLTPVAMSTRYLQIQMNPRLSRTAVPPSKTLTSKAPRTPFEFRYNHLK